MTTKRVMQRAPSEDQRYCHTCALKRAFLVVTTYQKKNRFGLLVEVKNVLGYCSTHGRQYAARFKLEVPS